MVHRFAALAGRSHARLIRVVVRNRRLYSHACPTRAHAARHLAFRRAVFWLGSRASGNRVENVRKRLIDTDRSRSLAAVGTRDGFFRIVYRFENEQLVELINRTAHAAALSALVETATAYRFYLGVYVRSVSRFTPFYIALIDPCSETDRPVPLA